MIFFLDDLKQDRLFSSWLVYRSAIRILQHERCLPMQTEKRCQGNDGRHLNFGQKRVKLYRRCLAIPEPVVCCFAC